MKKFITLITVLLLLFSITLTGCGGGTEEVASAEWPAQFSEVPAFTASPHSLAATFIRPVSVVFEIKYIQAFFIFIFCHIFIAYCVVMWYNRVLLRTGWYCYVFKKNTTKIWKNVSFYY